VTARQRQGWKKYKVKEMLLPPLPTIIWQITYKKCKSEGN
jgi:hypothetical protein